MKNITKVQVFLEETGDREIESIEEKRRATQPAFSRPFCTSSWARSGVNFQIRSGDIWNLDKAIEFAVFPCPNLFWLFKGFDAAASSQYADALFSSSEEDRRSGNGRVLLIYYSTGTGASQAQAAETMKSYLNYVGFRKSGMKRNSICLRAYAAWIDLPVSSSLSY